MQSHDFLLVVFEWSPSRRLIDSQIDTFRTKVEQLKPEAIVVTGIPRHHAKKLSQQDWTKDYYLSKETRRVTTSRSESTTPKTNTPIPISIVFSKYPTSSEQWFALTQPNQISGFAHIIEICIPLNAWKPEHCPLGLLQELQLTYDDVSTLTLVITTDITKELQASVNVNNTVIFIAHGAINSAESKFRYWKKLQPICSDRITELQLISIIGDTSSDIET